MGFGGSCFFHVPKSDSPNFVSLVLLKCTISDYDRLVQILIFEIRLLSIRVVSTVVYIYAPSNWRSRTKPVEFNH